MMIEKQPLIKSGWQRALLFTICLDLLVLLVSAGMALVGQGSNIYFVAILVPVVISLISVYLFRTQIDKRSVKSLGLEWKSHVMHAGTGFSLSILLLSAGSLLLVANGNLQWTGVSLNAAEIFSGLGLMALAAFSEELVFRGYILNNLLQSMNKWWALLASAIVFTLFHINNPGISFLPVLNVFLGGLLLGINYIYTGNLWYSILFHVAWNFYQGPVLGYHVSGLGIESLLQQELSGSPVFTGAAFGFEGSLVDALVSLIALCSLAWIYEKKFSSKLTKDFTAPAGK